LCAKVKRAMSLMLAAGSPAKVSRRGRRCLDDELPGRFSSWNIDLRRSARDKIVSNTETASGEGEPCAEVVVGLSEHGGSCPEQRGPPYQCAPLILVRVNESIV
jgi:hypothetical protein